VIVWPPHGEREAAERAHEEYERARRRMTEMYDLASHPTRMQEIISADTQALRRAGRLQDPSGPAGARCSVSRRGAEEVRGAEAAE
jgi:hypothetical protein